MRLFQKNRAAAALHGKRLLLFGGVGVANTAMDFAVFIGLMTAGLSPVLANVGGFVAANAQSYFLNAQLTFREDGRPAQMSIKGYAKFAGAHLVSLLISTGMIIAFSDVLGAVFAKAAAVVATLLWNYAASAFFVFREQSETKL